MIRLANPEYLIVAAVIPVLILLYFLDRRRRKALLTQIATPHVEPVLLESYDPRKHNRRFYIFLASVSLLIVALLGIEVGTRYEQVKISGIDMVIALDISSSMNAEDTKPSRLEKAKHEITTLLSTLGGDRVALVVFSGNAFLQCPMTSDYGAVRMLLDAVSGSTTTSAGTDFGSLCEVAAKAYVENKEGPAVGKALIIFSDGENHNPSAESDIEKLKSDNIRVYSVGVGSPQGAPIPIYEASGNLKDYKKHNGSIVTTRLEEDLLKQMAERTGGAYYSASPSESEIGKIYASVSKLQKADHAEYRFTAFEDRFQWFLAASIILLLLFPVVSERKKGSASRV